MRISCARRNASSSRSSRCPATRCRTWCSGCTTRRKKSWTAPSGRSALSGPRRLLLHDHLGSDLHAIVQIDDVLVGQPKAARRYRLPDRLRFVRAVDAVKRGAEIHRARAERVVGSAYHVARQVGPPSQHLSGRRPTRPFFLGSDGLDAAPAETVPANTNAIADRLSVSENVIEPPLLSVDDNSAGALIDGIANGCSPHRRTREEPSRGSAAAQHLLVIIPRCGAGADRRQHSNRTG